MEKDKILDLFGEDFVKNVRDESFDEFNTLKSGQMKSAQAQKIYQIFSSIEQSQQADVDFVVKQMIDRVLHKTLWFFEQSQTWAISTKQEIEENNLNDISEISDGLTGELYSEDGWIAKFSNHPTTV